MTWKYLDLPDNLFTFFDFLMKFTYSFKLFLTILFLDDIPL